MHKLIYKILLHLRANRCKEVPITKEGCFMSDYRMRTVEYLTDVEDPAWPEILSQVANSHAHILPVEQARGFKEIHDLQVTTRSYMGAMALNCGGIMTNNGWLRLLGGGSKELPSIAQASGLIDEPVGALIVGYDVTGGVFAVDGGGLGFAPGSICYYAIDTFEWQEFDLTHSQFISWALEGTNFQGFYQDLLWDGWEKQLSTLPSNYGFNLFPPPSTNLWRDYPSRTAHPVPLKEIAIAYTGIDLTSPNLTMEN